MSVNEKMTAIADAIRGKTGGTDALTLDQMPEAIAGIESGGGAKVATGSFTMAETSTIFPEIVHNLGTTKIIALFWVDADLVVPTAGYQLLAAAFVNTPAFIGDSVTVDVTGYNTKFTEATAVDTSTIALGAIFRSPWTTQANYTAPNIAYFAPGAFTVTEDTLAITNSQGSNNFISGYTYNYLIIGL